MEELLTVFLRWTSDLEKKSGLVSDISKGDSVPLAVTKAAGSGVLSYGDTINEAVIEGGKALWDSLKSGAMEIEAQKMLNEAKTTPKVDNSAGFVEIQKGNTSIFYIGNIDATDALSKNAKDEFTRLATHKIVSRSTMNIGGLYAETLAAASSAANLILVTPDKYTGFTPSTQDRSSRGLFSNRRRRGNRRSK